jgi:tryptophan synthase alpha chain
MSRLQETFRVLKERSERAFMPFITCGDPDLETTRALALAYVEAGADIIEIGIPFTDPLADGPTIQRSSERALANGTTMDDALNLIAELRASGYDQFAARCREVGVDAVIISDLPPEEGAEWINAAKQHNIDTIFFLAPTSDDTRFEAVAQATTGFIYALARMGVTGARSDVPPEIGDLITRVRQHTTTPVCAGFGFSSPEQIKATCAKSDLDGIIVGAALIDKIEKTSGSNAEKVATAARFARELKEATK